MLVDPRSLARIRGACVGAVSAVVSVAAHGLAGGAAPSESALSLLIVVCAAVGVLVASAPGATSGPVMLAAVLTLGQVIGHSTLWLTAEHAHAQAWTPQMLAAHAASVGVAAGVIRGAERAYRRAVSALARMLPVFFTATPPHVSPVHTTGRGPAPILDVLRAGGTGTRAPPISV
ncbi:hypothetical protein [Rhodococcus wratislaviensis]|uniref:hypothetical protein n=1 Tax=Rhodococcus wratislaviensis TaxID=44752 RepID=UPI00365B5D30